MENKTTEYLRRIYSPEDSELRQLQNVMLNLLVHFDKICKENKIRYSLSHGTLLGAVRHKGFIPWDDDVDIMIFPEDFRKLQKVLEREDDRRYVLHTIKNDFNYPFLYPKYRDEQKEVSSNLKRGKLYKYKGIGIDIFPLQRTNAFVAKVANAIYYRVVTNIHYKIKNEIIRKLYTRTMQFLLLKILFPVLNFPVLIFGNKNEYHHALGIPWTKCAVFIDEFFPLSSVEFENHTFPAPKDTDAFLTRRYGDYMTMPSQENILKTIHSIEFRNEIIERLKNEREN